MIAISSHGSLSNRICGVQRRIYLVGDRTMDSGKWLSQAIPTNYLSTRSLRLLPSFPYSNSPICLPMGTGNHTCGNLPFNLGSPDHFNRGSIHAGPQTCFSTPSYPVSTRYQTYLEPGTTLYTTPNDYQNSTMHHQYNNENLQPSLYDQFPLATLPSWQLEANCQAGADFMITPPFNFGYNIQRRCLTLDWGDSRAVSMEIRKLKEAWREGVGLKKKYRCGKKLGCYEGSREHSATGQLDRLGVNDTEFSVKARSMVCDPVKEHEDNFNGESSTNSNSSSILSSLNGPSLADENEDVLTEREEFEKLEPLPSPKMTPTQKTPAMTRFEGSPVNDANEKYHLLHLSHIYNTEKAPTSGPLPFEEGSPSKHKRSSTGFVKRVASLYPIASRLPTSKEIPTSKCKESSTNFSKGVSGLYSANPCLPLVGTPAKKGQTQSSTCSCKGLASLRPPKPITRSSKPVTRPVPFNLVGETVARKLRSRREQRSQIVGDMT